MQIYGLMMLRNEADIIRINVLHHLALGIDRFLIVDNGSSDGTDQVLQELSADPRVRWTRYDGLYRQSEVTTELAREAYLRGADWVVPIDADEFWYAPGGHFRRVLERTSAGALQVEVVNFVQRRQQLESSAEALLNMTLRPPKTYGPIMRAVELVESCKIGFVEIEYVSKWISRASMSLEIGVGNHFVRQVNGGQRRCNDIVVLHAPLRSRTVLESQAEHGKRAEPLGNHRLWHYRRWRRLAEEGPLDAEWEANSYAEDCLDVYGVPHPLVEDTRLRDVVAPWIGQEVAMPVRSESFAPPLDLKGQWAATPAEGVGAILARVRGIEGWLEEPEARLLLATTVLALIEGEPHGVVEIGSYQGRSTVLLGSVVKAVCSEVRVSAIDPHEGEVTLPDNKSYFHAPTLAKLQANLAMAGLSEIVEVIVQRSYQVSWDKPISLLFIDGLHDYQNVARDFAHFEGWVVSGGYIVFDDYDPIAFPGVVSFVDEVLGSGRYQEVQRVGRLVVTRKWPSPAGYFDSASRIVGRNP